MEFLEKSFPNVEIAIAHGKVAISFVGQVLYVM